MYPWHSDWYSKDPETSLSNKLCLPWVKTGCITFNLRWQYTTTSPQGLIKKCVKCDWNTDQDQTITLRLLALQTSPLWPRSTVCVFNLITWIIVNNNPHCLPGSSSGLLVSCNLVNSTTGTTKTGKTSDFNWVVYTSVKLTFAQKSQYQIPHITSQVKRKLECYV